MEIDDYGFYFENTGRGENQGPNDPSGEFFTNVDLEQSLAREVIQNSLDARADGAKVVTVEFELRMIPTIDIPGIQSLREAAKCAVDSNQDLQGLNYMVDASTATKSVETYVLRVGDAGTKGLQGSESITDPHSPLSTLSRSSGASSNDGNRGGSFGIGSAVGQLASSMRTVAYISLPEGSVETVFAATTKLASHVDSAGARRNGTGFYTNLAVTQDFQYLRGLGRIGSFPFRSAPGTDLYVLGYKEAAEDLGLQRIKRSVVENFLVAIHRGNLEVTGEGPDSSWVLSADSLEDVIRSDDELVVSMLPYYDALTKNAPINGTLSTIGDVQLYLQVEGSADRPMGAQVMRSPLMRVQNFNPTSIQIPYAAIFICEDPAGNKRLRECEPPTHDRWNYRGTRSDPAAVGQVRAFIREAIRNAIPEKIGSSTRIKGLERFLPSMPVIGGAKGTSQSEGEAAHEASDIESLARIGVEHGSPIHDWRPGSPVSIFVNQRANPDPNGVDGATWEITDDGAPGPKRKPKKRSKAVEGEGPARIRSSDVEFRSFANRSDGFTTIVLRARADVEGEITLAALGGGDRDAYEVGLLSADRVDQDGEHSLEVNGASVLKLALAKGEQTQIRVRFTTGARYRLGVKND